MRKRAFVRIEHIDGRGLWTSRDIAGYSHYSKFSFVIELREKHSMFNTPHRDGLSDVMTREHFCAFKSINQLERWIEKDWWKEIIECGFKVLLIYVSKYHVGKDQVIFRKEDILESRDISSLFYTKEDI